MPRQMLVLASMFTWVVRARRRCSGIDPASTPSPVVGSISSGASSPAGNPRSMRRRSQPVDFWSGRHIAERQAGERLRRHAVGDQRPADKVRTGHHGLAQEVGPKPVEIALRLTGERVDESGAGSDPTVDRIGSEVVLQHDLRAAPPGSADTRRTRPPPSGTRSWARRSRSAAATGPTRRRAVGDGAQRATKPSDVIGSSSSGSRTVSSASRIPAGAGPGCCFPD